MSDKQDRIAEQLEVFAQFLRQNGLKMTRQREMVVESFLKTDGHLSTEELYELVRRKDKKLGFTTVFRTMKALTQCGLARETHLSDGRTRFEHLYRRPHHHHIVCVECNRAIEFFSPKLEQLQEEIVSEYNFTPVRHEVQIFGVCSDCENQRKSKQKPYDSDLVFARDALQIAMETEKRRVNFYRTASEIVCHETTRQTFLRMLEEEQGHLDELHEEWGRLIRHQGNILEAPVFLHFDYDALKRIFPSKEEIRKKLRENLSEEEALLLAMEMEQQAGEFFARYAERFNDTRGRDIFLKFAAEEEDHYNLIKAEYDRVVQASQRSSVSPDM